MRLAVDATALLLPRTGIGTFVAEVLRALSARPELEVSAFNVSWRGRGRGWLPDDIPDTVVEVPGRLPTGRARLLWEHVEVPPLEWFAGTADVVHGFGRRRNAGGSPGPAEAGSRLQCRHAPHTSAAAQTAARGADAPACPPQARSDPPDTRCQHREVQSSMMS